MHQRDIQKQEAELLIASSTYREFLERLYFARKARLERYTYVRLSTDLGFSATGFIHQIVRGRRALTADAARRIGDALRLRSAQRDFLQKLVELGNAPSPASHDAAAEILRLRTKLQPGRVGEEVAEFFTTWYYAVVREMVAMQDFVDDPEWIAATIVPAITPAQARQSLDLLERLALIGRDPRTGRWIQCEEALATLADAPILESIAFQRHALELGKQAIQLHEPEKRLLNSVTLRLSPETFAALREQIWTQINDLLTLESEGGADDGVYQLNIQLFPLTKERKKQGEAS